ncbi:Protein arginine N-methyltransferase 5 [Coemansia erecta]|nr:Protein arginine N-methyltransferase 5 [Coemansia erecta]
MSSEKAVVAIGIEPSWTVDDADAFVDESMVSSEADFALLDITKPQDSSSAANEGCFFELNDVVVKTPTNGYCIVGKTAAWLSTDHGALVVRQMEYASYIGLRRVMVPGPAADTCLAAYSQMLLAAMHSDSGVSALTLRLQADEESWEKLAARARAVRPQHGSLALDLSRECDIEQWRAEPVQLAVVPEPMFTANPSGYPVLWRKDQEIVRRLSEIGAAIAVRHSGDASDCVRYLRHLTQAADKSAAQEATDLYRDVLQVPLQPLMNHLESVTYETFEADLPKYDAYEIAIRSALEACAKSQPVLMVAGAGRGPLVSRALAAATSLGRSVRMVAIEKNPGAMVTLQRRNASEWNGAVELVHGDMRMCEPSARADILISELLGSFGDNELAPECMDAAVARLVQLDGVSIPSRYTAYAAPLSSSLLHARASKNTDGYGLETPYVVNVHAARVLAPTQRVWSFDHSPAKGSPMRFERFASIAFVCSAASVVHGLVGYFDATLFGSHCLSTLPQAHTPNMDSWFPMFFPLKASISS